MASDRGEHAFVKVPLDVEPGASEADNFTVRHRKVLRCSAIGLSFVGLLALGTLALRKGLLQSGTELAATEDTLQAYAKSFQQCGGQDYTGSTCCQKGCACILKSRFYSMCATPSNTGKCSVQAAQEEIALAKTRVGKAKDAIATFAKAAKAKKKQVAPFQKAYDKAREPLEKLRKAGHKAKEAWKTAEGELKDAQEAATEAATIADEAAKKYGLVKKHLDHFDEAEDLIKGGQWGANREMATPEPGLRCGECGEDDDDDDSCDDSDCSSDLEDGEPDDGERKHFLDVCWSFMDHPRDAAHELARLKSATEALDPEDVRLWLMDPQTWLLGITQRVEVNSRFLRLLPVPEVCGADLGPESERLVREVPPRHRVASRNSSKVRSTLQQFVRDWAKEGAPEREASYAPLIQALRKHLPPGRGPAPTVLCPGCGLGRLPFDLVRCGYAAQGNEFSYHMLLGSHLILNRCCEAECHVIYPFALSTANRRGSQDHLRAVKVPDLCPRNALPPGAELSMAAGEFIEVYNDQFGEWDAVATCFFLDTAKNVFLYIRTIAQIVRCGGIWTNIGPLLYHYADVENEISIELSWEEVRPAICKYFDIVEEKVMISHYAANPSALSGVRYRCKFFVAVRNSTPPSGMSHRVF